MEKIFFSRILNPFKAAKNTKYKYQVYFTIEITQLEGNPHPDITVSGVHGPLRTGNSIGGCGQNIDNYIDDKTVEYNKGWNKKLYLKLINFWKQNHLKKCEPGTEYYNQIIKESNKFPESTRIPAWH